MLVADTFIRKENCMSELRPDPAPVPVSPRPSSAVVLARKLITGGFEVFMVRRHIKSEFVPDAFVFPGGSVKLQDIETEQASNLCASVASGPTALGSGFRVAALRECFEEAGVLLARREDIPLAITAADTSRFAAYRDALYADRMALATIAEREELTLATDDLLWWAHWITPEESPRRFSTFFFLAPMPEQQEAAHDQLETTAGRWITPQDALDSFAHGEFPLVFATIHQLRELAQLSSLAEAWQRFTDMIPRTIMPHVEQRNGADVIVLPDEDQAGE
jgi:8-oxo-dGTP pyrophosphatase MutT (NUDIX family)